MGGPGRAAHGDGAGPAGWDADLFVLTGHNRCGNRSNFRPIRTDWIVNRLGWAPTPENLLSAAAAFGETPYAV